MKKLRKISLLLAVTILFGSISFVCSAAEYGGLYNFKKTYNFYENRFDDVSKYDWFYPYVAFAYEQALMQGDSYSTFNPYGEITLAETIALASRIHSIYYTGRTEFLNASPWYRYYVEYALYNKIIPSEYSDYDVTLSREEFASILANALPSSEFNKINSIAYGSLPDVPETNIYADDIYMLYNAGILTGNDKYGTFSPLSSIHRCEVSTIISRMIDITLRKKNSFEVMSNSGTVVPKVKLTPEEISKNCSSAVFYVEIYSYNGANLASGSGFFISDDGYAITNRHVVENAGYLEIMTTDGKVYNDVRVVDYDSNNDIALIKINSNEKFHYLKPDPGFKLIQGQTAYAIGSPQGLTNTLSQGLISNVERTINGALYIQTSAQIDGGSSGGALINEYGNVIGVITASLGDAADLNFAVPIKFMENLDKNSTQECIVWDEVYYPDFTRIPDFEAFSGMTVIDCYYTPKACVEMYSMADFYPTGTATAAENYAKTLSNYWHVLLENGMNEVVFNNSQMIYESYDESLRIDVSYEDMTFTVTAEKKPEYYDYAYPLVDLGWYCDMPCASVEQNGAGGYTYTYKWSDYYSLEEFANAVLFYVVLLSEKGFEIAEDLTSDDASYALYKSDLTSVVFKKAKDDFCVYVNYKYDKILPALL